MFLMRFLQVTLLAQVFFSYSVSTPARPLRQTFEIKANELADQLQNLTKEPASNATFTSLVQIYEKLVNFNESLNTYNVNEHLVNNYSKSDYLVDAEVGRRILADTATIFGNISTNVSSEATNISSVVIKIIKEMTPGTVLPREFRKAFPSATPMLEVGFIDVRAMCLVNELTYVAFVAYPTSKSVFRNVPSVKFAMKNYQIFDLIIIQVAEIVEVDRSSTPSNCPDYPFFQALIIGWHSRTLSLGVRYGCAQWMEDTRSWSSENCFQYTPASIPAEMVCYCDTRNNNKTTQYIVFEYLEDTDKHFSFQLFTQNSSNKEELQQTVRLIRDIGNNPVDSSAFESVISSLFTVMNFDADSLHALGNSSLLDDIGKILLSVVPDDDSGIIGRSNNLISSFVLQLDTYEHDPLIGYAFFTNHSQKLTYFRTKDFIDLESTSINKIFSYNMDYSVLFSKSVVLQNNRYGLVLYPPDKFFLPADVIDGHKVLASRVVDVLLLPHTIYPRDRAQLVHMYFNPTFGGDQVTKCGCAYWSATMTGWSTIGCFTNPQLYRDVCSCRMSSAAHRTRTRGQYISFRYSDVDFHNPDNGALLDYKDFDEIASFTFVIHQLKNYKRYGKKTVRFQGERLSDILFNPNGTMRLNAQTSERLIQETRNTLVGIDCDARQNHADGLGFGVVCVNMSDSGESGLVVAFSTDKLLNADNSNVNTFTSAQFSATKVFSRNTLIAVHVSQSVRTMNSRYSFLVYPLNVYIKQLPSTRHLILSSRVVDVVLMPRGGTQAVNQYVELYIDQVEYNASQACAFWSSALNSWTSLGCHMIVVNSLQICNCSLSGNALQNVTGGQFLIYTYSHAFFDEDVFANLRSGSNASLTDETIFRQGTALIHNASQIIVDDDLVIKMQTYKKVLAIDPGLLSERRREIDVTLRDLELVFSRFCVRCYFSVVKSYGINGALSVKSAAVSDDLFSNAVLTANDTGDVAMTSDMAFVAIGYLYGQNLFGLYIARSKVEELHLTSLSSLASVLDTFATPLFACVTPIEETLRYFRFVFIVYPINMSPYPRTMTSSPIFNARQVDVYMDHGHDDCKNYFFDSNAPATLLDVFFQPAENPNNYTKIACAHWDDALNDWSSTLCRLNATPNAHVYCSCDLANRSVTRIIVYEYTDLLNFSFVDVFPAPLVTYLVGASLSFVGLIIIFATALVFPKWRAVLGHKILLHLSFSSFLYLSLTTFLETHTIFADSNHDDVALIVFTICVHYSRFAHFTWGLAMSVLQYKKFSSLVGMTTVHHLLLKVSLLAWGIPIVPIVILLAWDHKLHFCSPDIVTHYTLYLVPGIVITAVNLGLLVAIVYNITNKCGTGEEEALQRHNVAEKDLIKRRLTTVLLMFFLLGFPTVFEMSNDFGSHNVTVDYFSKILDPIQGFVMFLFFIVVNEGTRKLWYDKIFVK